MDLGCQNWEVSEDPARSLGPRLSGKHQLLKNIFVSLHADFVDVGLM